MPVTPGVKRGIREAKALLEQAGHTVVPFKMPHRDKLVDLYFDHLLCENGKLITTS